LRDVTNTKGLSDLRTATTSRIHAKPPQKGTEYLNLYLLDKEAQRLEKELAGLEQRQRRIWAHLAEIRKAMETLEMEARQATSPQASSHLTPSPPGPAALPSQLIRDRQQPLWKKMAVEY